MKSSIILSALALGFLATGCLKDEAFDNGEIQSTHTRGTTPKMIELKLTATNASNFFVLAMDNSDADTTIDLVPVNLATKDPAPEDIHVTVELDPATVEAYNTAHADDVGFVPYEVPSADKFSVSSTDIVIPKGSHTGYVQVKFKVSDFLGGRWAVGFKIKEVAQAGYTISGNMSTGIAVLIVKNEWDGVYGLSGVIGGSNAYVGMSLGGNITLSTVNENTVSEGDIVNFFAGYTEFTFKDDGTVGVAAFDSPGGSSYGATVVSSSYDKTTHNFDVTFTILGGRYVFETHYVRK